MKARRRRLILCKAEFGAPVAARCSVCHQPFEVEFTDDMTLGAAHDKLAEMFDSHTCDEGSSLAALRVAGEATEGKYGATHCPSFSSIGWVCHADKGES